MGFFDNLLKTVTGEKKAEERAAERAAERAEYAAEIAANGEKPCKKYLVLYGELPHHNDYKHGRGQPLLFITEQAMWIPGHPETAISSKNGVNNKTYRFKIDHHTTSGVSTTVTKDASVVKRAVVGGVVAGGAGAVVGAISAADANAKGGVQKTVRTGGGLEVNKIFIPDFPEYRKGYERKGEINRILCFDTSKSLPEKIRKALNEGDYQTLAQRLTFMPFVNKEDPKNLYNGIGDAYKFGEECKYDGLTIYKLTTLHTKEDAQNVITFIDKFAKGEETGQLLEEYIVTLNYDFLCSRFFIEFFDDLYDCKNDNVRDLLKAYER